MAVDYSGFDYSGPDVTGQDSGNGSALDSILASVSKLGAAAIVTYGPQNAGLPTNQGILQPGLSAYTPGKAGISVIVIAILLIAGVFLYKKL